MSAWQKQESFVSDGWSYISPLTTFDGLIGFSVNESDYEGAAVTVRLERPGEATMSLDLTLDEARQAVEWFTRAIQDVEALAATAA